MELRDKVGVVTGGHKGLGADIVDLILREGGKVVAVSRSGRPKHAAPVEGVMDMRGDVTHESTVTDAIALCLQTYGGFDFIVNNAGILGEGSLHKTTNEVWDQLVATHLTASFWGCKHATNTFRERGTGGVVLNVGSILSLAGEAYLGAYTAMKHGVLGLTKAFAIDHASDGIRYNCLCPGDMDTPMIQDYYRGTGDAAAAERNLAQAYPGGRIAQSLEVAEAAVFLLGSRASFISGTSLVVDGGLLANAY
ncbi:MAG: SDR family oxidoreductase [Mycobacterium sp.]